MQRRHVLALALILAAPTICRAADNIGPAQTASIAEAVAPSLVRVEYTLQFDKSQSPYGVGWRSRCPGCGKFHISQTDEIIPQERPVEVFGYVIAPDLVLTSDPLMHERFIQEIAVRSPKDNQLIPATPVSYALGGNAVFLKLEQPLANAKPLAFDAARSAPYYTVSYARGNGTWSIGVEAMSGNVSIAEDGRKYTNGSPCALIVDGAGNAVGVCLNDELPIDGSWKGSPTQWQRIERDALKRQLADFEASASKALPRVHVMFRSPKSDQNQMRYRYGRGDAEAITTEWHGTGVLIDPTTILVLANLKPDVTARLERIRVHAPDGDPVTASFKATMKDYGAFLATLDRPLSSPATLDSAAITNYRHDMLLGAEIEIQGERRVGYYTHTRIPSFEIGWRGRTYPSTQGGEQFLFAREGSLIAIPMTRREKVTVEERWGQHGGSTLIPAAHLSEALSDLTSATDASNIPLSEEDESRIAWMGVELQDLDSELARMNDVSELTRDGSIGALVTWVYEGSPAAEAGIAVGDILLRLHVPGHPKPLDIEGADEDMFGAMGFPWDRLDEVPEQYFDQIPTPWPSANNSLNRKLTLLGFGTSYTAEAVRDGEVLRLQLAVVQSPSHYDAARKHKSDMLGLTVREITYEVRRYLQRQPTEPGVIIARIEPGSRASIAGVKPFEVVTHVNDQPVMSVADFEKLVPPSGELRLAIKRMTRGRIVKIELDKALPPPPPVEDDEMEFEMVEELED